MSEAIASAIQDVGRAWARLEMARATLMDAPHATLADQCLDAQQRTSDLLENLKARRIVEESA